MLRIVVAFQKKKAKIGLKKKEKRQRRFTSFLLELSRGEIRNAEQAENMTEERH